LAGVRYRTSVLGATRILVVVGAPQQQHLNMVFAVARAAGWLVEPARAEHVAFGSVLGSDKRMFRTRAGESIKLIELLDEAVQRTMKVAKDKRPDLEAASAEAVARAVGIGAVKYADLSSDRIKDYVFDWDRMLALDGNTAPYLQYAHARICSIFLRAGLEDDELAHARELRVDAPAERALVLELLGFQAAVRSVAATLQPHRLCTYLYALANRFSGFYEQCPVLKSPDPGTLRSRLLLCRLTARTLAQGLELLGIEAPERM
jgi:arginyl-tRNA synthetase